MNLGLGDYGSDSENGDGDEEASIAQPVRPLKSVPSTAPSKMALPPPKQRRGPKKITIGLPTLNPTEDDTDDLKDECPAAKKPRLETGAGMSSLVSMLPAPKQKNPVLPPPERVLGGGGGPGLVFNAPRPAARQSAAAEGGHSSEVQDVIPDSTSLSTSFSFRPTSLAKGRANISLEEGATKAPPRTATKAAPTPAVDFFSLGAATPAASHTVASSSSTAPLPTLSSAPVIPKFEPPEPTPTDPYPGYYTLPSGAWAAYDPGYYATFTKKWQAEYNAHVRALEKGQVKGFEGLDSAAVEEVDAMKEMEKAKLEMQERASRKAVTRGADGAPAAPNIKLTASKQSGIARSRHQLATMLHEAYSNREALEERIAEGRRNRKEAGNKYGERPFSVPSHLFG
ncbi:mitotic checkpoint regulator, MAD2B-interacting-domain-containing protein [Mycena rosella]|uniref:Mitotic checkpoint regulator, MAD2B-interacting-domain-containing protein n=1 Tax=Mycena rosella TaxID=1033263 RepID=A0AAD7MCA6_MYCRO|nr:mitotic checkpoint regulator, MAD2B-interacting-domain-containing protein [Mycena rosella]